MQGYILPKNIKHEKRDEVKLWICVKVGFTKIVVEGELVIVPNLDD